MGADKPASAVAPRDADALSSAIFEKTSRTILAQFYAHADESFRTLIQCAGSVALLFLSAGLLSAEDGATLYKQSCAACHDTGLERAPNRVALRAMTPERVLAALETGAMISMTSGRTAVERRGVAEFVTGKPFGRPLVTTPSPQSMCAA